MKINNKSEYGIAFLLMCGGLSFAQNSPPNKNTSADNSGINERDRKSTELTADQQGSGKSDVEITRLIRKNIMGHRELSTYAHNVKIIASNGFVTLKGPVRSQQEMTTIAGIAEKACGTEKVKNEMQIASAE